MVNYFKALLPVTTIVDDLLVPESGVDESFSEQERFFFGGFHCTAWIKLYALIAFVACFTFLETILEEATYMKAEFYDLNRPFNGFMDLLIEWERNSFSFWCMSGMAVLIAVMLILILAMQFKNPFFLVPIQLALLASFYTLLKRMFVTYVENMSMSYELYRDMDEMLAHLQHYRSRDTWLSSRFDLHPKYEPLVRNGSLFASMTLCLGIEYAVERSMQFYGYDEFLDKLNRPFVLVYRKWQFKRMMKRRKAHQMARLIRKHRNMNGNFTWAPAIAENCSFKTAIENTSLLTAIDLEDAEESITVPIKVNQSFGIMQLPELFGQATSSSEGRQTFVPDDYMRDLFLPNSRPFVLFEPVRCLRMKNPLFLAYGALHRFPDIGISSENAKDIDGLLSKAKKQLKLRNFDMAERFIEQAKKMYLDNIPPRMLDFKISHPNILYTLCLLENARNLNKIGERFGSIQRASVNLPQSLPNQSLSQTLTNLFKENWQKELDQLFNQLLPLVDNEDNALLEVVYRNRHILCERSQKRQKLNVIGAYFKNIYSTVAIENVPTSLQDVANCLKNGFNFPPSNLSDEIRSREEIVGAAQAYCRILRECKDGPLSVELLHDLHRLLVSGVPDLAEHAGVFKKEDKECLGEHNNTQLYEAPLKEFLDWYNGNAVAKINNGKVDPILIATLMHGFFVALHPYKDGNGRLSRLILNIVLIKAGFPPIRISEERKCEYYDANDDFFRGEPRTFYRFLCNCILETIKDYLDMNMATVAGAASPTETEQSRGLIAGSDKLSSSSKTFISLDSDSFVRSATIWPTGVNSSLCAAADVDFNDIQPKLLLKPSDYDWIDWPNIILQEIAKLGTNSTVTDVK